VSASMSNVDVGPLSDADHATNGGQTPHWPFPIAQESAAHELWDDAALKHIANDTVRRARDTGALAAIPPALAYRAGVHVYTGELATAATLIEEANAITASTGHAPVKYHSLNVAAWRGVATEAVGLIEAAAADATARGSIAGASSNSSSRSAFG
jgi:hypothetical protein